MYVSCDCVLCDCVTCDKTDCVTSDTFVKGGSGNKHDTRYIHISASDTVIRVCDKVDKNKVVAFSHSQLPGT